MLRFTRGKKKICPTIKTSQNIMNMIVGPMFFPISSVRSIVQVYNTISTLS